MTDEAKKKPGQVQFANPTPGVSAPVAGMESQPVSIKPSLEGLKPLEAGPVSLDVPAQIEQQPAITTGPTPAQPLTPPAATFEASPPAQTQGTLPKVDLTYLPPGDSPNNPGTWKRRIGHREKGKGKVEFLAA